MPFTIIRSDITKMKVDAIVNAANESLLGGGGVDGAIHRAAGPGLLEECRKLNGCGTGEAKLTKGYALPAKYVIHTVGPIWSGGGQGEEEALMNAYGNSLSLAKETGCESVAFPLISAGAYGYPRAEALEVAVRVIKGFLAANEMTVYLVVFDKTSYVLSRTLFDGIKTYIDDNYAEKNYMSRPRHTKAKAAPGIFGKNSASAETYLDEADSFVPFETGAVNPEDLEHALMSIDESFSEMVLRKIDEKGMMDAECYKKANIDRKLFSKIRSNKLYKPSKATALALGIALELPIDELRELLMKAGFALSHSSKADIIIEYFVLNGNYDIFSINEALFAFDQVLLGG